MKTGWDYSNLAEAYLKRPDYSRQAIEQMLAAMHLPAGALVCDVGAGVAHLTLELAAQGFDVVAVEPNDKMRQLGQVRTAGMEHVRWHVGTGEATGQADRTFDLVSFGSSFNVCDRALALQESHRILTDQGWFACMWNHRDLKDPLQAAIEATIRQHLPHYGYGSRREDQTQIIQDSGLFGAIQFVSGRVHHRQSKQDCITAWRSHATLLRQAGDRFEDIIAAIEALLDQQAQAEIEIPYVTRIWFCQKIHA